MLKGINTGGRYLQVMGGTSSTYISRSYNSNVHMTGSMMYDIDSQSIKVYDGKSWQILAGSYATVDLTYEAQSILHWAEKKMKEEQQLAQLAQEHPTIKSLVDDIKQKQEQIKMVQTLINSPGNEPTPSMVP